MIEDDIVSIINQLCPSVKNVVTDATYQIRQPVHGVWVRQRQTTGRIETLLHCDETYCDIAVRGEGGSEVGRKNAWDTAQTVYKALCLVMDTTVNGTHYIRIHTDSAPFVVPSTDGNFDMQFGISVLRYFGD